MNAIKGGKMNALDSYIVGGPVFRARALLSLRPMENIRQLPNLPLCS